MKPSVFSESLSGHAAREFWTFRPAFLYAEWSLDPTPSTEKRDVTSSTLGKAATEDVCGADDGY